VHVGKALNHRACHTFKAELSLQDDF